MDAQCIYLMNQCSFFQICGVGAWSGWVVVQVPGVSIKSELGSILVA